MAKTAVKYPKPKIMLIDTRSDVSNALELAGYTVTVGTFGTPIKSNGAEEWHPLKINCDLPGHEEQEVVFASTFSDGCLPAGAIDAAVVGANVRWQLGSSGSIDPRPFVMDVRCAAFDRILAHGGVFVIQCGPRDPRRERWGVSNGYGTKFSGDTEGVDHWGFLTTIAPVEVKGCQGTEISFEGDPLARCLARAGVDARYSCSIANVGGFRGWQWTCLARNKYGAEVAAILRPEGKPGAVVLLPRMPSLATVVLELVERWMPEWSPKLFPHLESVQWPHHPRYEIPAAVRISDQIRAVEASHEITLAKLREDLVVARTKDGYLHKLIIATGRELVLAVIEALGRMGFVKVIDVDEAAKGGPEAANPREDLQIRDRNPVLVIDVKGVAGHPSDDETQQAQKHAMMRIREWNRPDVQSLTIINHQRGLPPHDRDQRAFREPMIQNAQQVHAGLMTGWDLFNLCMNMERLGWPKSAVQDVFYQTGRIDPVPSHYEEIGRVERAMRPAFQLTPSAVVRVGATLAIRSDHRFTEFQVASIRVKEAQVESVAAGEKCMIGWSAANGVCSERDEVFLVNPVVA